MKNDEVLDVILQNCEASASSYKERIEMIHHVVCKHLGLDTVKPTAITPQPTDTTTQYNPADYGDKSSGLQFEIEHLKACIKYDKWLESEVMQVGSKYLKVRDGQTYSSVDCWEAIKKQLESK